MSDLTAMGVQIAALSRHIRAMAADDDVAWLDTLEGETNAITAARHVVEEILVLETMAEGMGGLLDRLKTREARLKARAERLRGSLSRFMGEIGEKRLPLPEATVVLAEGQAHVIGDGVAGLPDALVRTKREPDKTAIKQALEAGDTVPGYSLSNKQPRLQIRVR